MMADSRYVAAVWLAALLLDYGIGDPWGWLHPVQVMGWLIQRYTALVLPLQLSAAGERLAGVGLTVGLVSGSIAVGWGLHTLAGVIHPAIAWITDSTLLASCLAARSLRDAADDVLAPLQAGNLAEARDRLSRYVGRDTAQLSDADMLRAVLETVSENATDGVTGPLFFGLVGMATPLGGMPLALGYKAASTLDSMVGYKRAPYTNLGWCSAKTEDLLTWLPCRLTVLTIALLSGRPGFVLRRCRQDAVQDPSPNAGWSECAYAAALEVQVGGLNYYGGVAIPKPKLGCDRRPITPEVIQQALRLTRYSVWLWVTVALAGLGVAALN